MGGVLILISALPSANTQLFFYRTVGKSCGFGFSSIGIDWGARQYLAVSYSPFSPSVFFTLSIETWTGSFTPPFLEVYKNDHRQASV